MLGNDGLLLARLAALSRTFLAYAHQVGMRVVLGDRVAAPPADDPRLMRTSFVGRVRLAQTRAHADDRRRHQPPGRTPAIGAGCRLRIVAHAAPFAEWTAAVALVVIERHGGTLPSRNRAGAAERRRPRFAEQCAF